MHRRISPASVLTFGLFLASAGFMLWAVQTIVLEPGPLSRGAREVLEEAPVRNSMATRLSEAVATRMPAGVAVDPDALALVAGRTMQQPEFVSAFGGALDRVQQHVVDDADGPITLDAALVIQALRAATVDQPQVAAAFTTDTPVVVEIPSDEIPNLARWADVWRAAVRALVFVGLLLVTYGVLRVEHRLWALGRIGRWMIGVGVATLAVIWLLPLVLLRPLGGWIGVGGAVLGSSAVLVPISLALMGLGLAAVAGAHRWEAHDRRQVLSVIPNAPTRSTNGSNPWESPV